MTTPEDRTSVAQDDLPGPLPTVSFPVIVLWVVSLGLLITGIVLGMIYGQSGEDPDDYVGAFAETGLGTQQIWSFVLIGIGAIGVLISLATSAIISEVRVPLHRAKSREQSP